MKKIYRHLINPSLSYLSLPKESIVRSVVVEDGFIYVYVEGDISQELTTRFFKTFLTDEKIPDLIGCYYSFIDTVAFPDGQIAHVYEVKVIEII